MKTTLGMAKVNLRHARMPQLTAGIGFAIGILTYAISFLIDNSNGQNLVVGNCLFLLPLCMAIFIPTAHFTKLMNLGGRRKEFFKSAIFSYIPAIVIAAAVSIITRLTIDKAIVLSGKLSDTVDLLDVLGFASHGSLSAFFQISAVLFLFCCILHTMTLIQGKWYGWIVDIFIIVMIFSPLNAALVWFFNMVIFHNIILVQIISCLLFGSVIYALSFIPIQNKPI